MDGLPQVLLSEALESEEYIDFTISWAVCLTLVARMDRYMVICKTFVGENSHIDGFVAAQEV